MSREAMKLGVFLCKCGTNIAGFVDLDAVQAKLTTHPDVSFVSSHNLMCSPEGRKFVEETIARHHPDHVLVAACSPKMHEQTFRDAAVRAGLNMGMVQIVNLREQCAWVTPDVQQATRKALTLIRKVVLIEKEVSLGGEVIKTEEVAPNMECAPCLLAPRLSAIRDNPNIQVVANAEVTDVLGFFGNFTVKVRAKARYVTKDCIGCEACFEACPTSVRSRFHLGLGTRKAIYTLFPGSVPAAAIIDRDACRHFTHDSCDACVGACPFGAIDFNDTDRDLEFQAGAVILAAGHGAVDPSGIARLGYGKIDNVYTLAEFERLASSNGPCGGQILLRNGKQPASLAVLNCVGSLSDEGVPYCSGTCCLLAGKVGHLARAKIPGVSVYNLHDRLVFAGPAGQAFHRHQIEAGTKYLHVEDLASVHLTQGPRGIHISANGIADLDVDMVVLVTGVTPAAGLGRLAEQLNIDRDAHGFLKPDHPVLHQAGTTLDGIYAVGGCVQPCDSGAAVTMAQAAVGDALSKLVPGRRIQLEAMTSCIDKDTCAGCRMCVAVCPYKAISYDTEEHVCAVNEALCRGCGTCAATCPSGACTAKHYTNTQIYAEIGGVVHG
jgi:heterodisulfide reductase subunit A